MNIVSKQEVQNTYYLLNCIPFGEKQYADFVGDRLVKKSIHLHATISKKYYSIYSDTLVQV